MYTMGRHWQSKWEICTEYLTSKTSSLHDTLAQTSPNPLRNWVAGDPWWVGGPCHVRYWYHSRTSQNFPWTQAWNQGFILPGHPMTRPHPPNQHHSADIIDPTEAPHLGSKSQIRWTGLKLLFGVSCRAICQFAREQTAWCQTQISWESHIAWGPVQLL